MKKQEPEVVLDRYKPISKAERETTILWDEEERVVHVYSASPVVWRKLARFGIEPIRVTRHADSGVIHGRFYEVPLRWLRWSIREPKSRPVTDAMRERGFSLSRQRKLSAKRTEPPPERPSACPEPDPPDNAA